VIISTELQGHVHRPRQWNVQCAPSQEHCTAHKREDSLFFVWCVAANKERWGFDRVRQASLRALGDGHQLECYTSGRITLRCAAARTWRSLIHSVVYLIHPFIDLIKGHQRRKSISGSVGVELLTSSSVHPPLSYPNTPLAKIWGWVSGRLGH